MKKRLLLIALVIMLVTGTVVQTEMRAEAAAVTTVTVVTIAKAVLVLLAIAGVGITLGTIFDNDSVSNDTVSGFTNWLNNRDPELYTEFMIAASGIAAGRLVSTLSPRFYSKLKQYTNEYFGDTVGTETAVGTQSFNIQELAITANGSQSIEIPGIGNINSVSNRIRYIPFFFTVLPNYRYCFFLPANYEQFSLLTTNQFFTSYTGGRISGLSYGNTTGVYADYWFFSGNSNMTFFNTKAILPDTNQNTLREFMQACINKLYSGQYSDAEEDVKAAPFETVGDVAATSVDATVVGAGQAITEDNGEIVIDGDRTINLSNVNIDEWLKALAEGTITYEQAMQAIGLAAVNTQTQTLEEVQAIAQALNPAAAGTGTITGNYTVSLTDLFPFCIPFDLYNIISCFKADPVAPSAEITIPVGYDGNEFTWETYTVSLSAFDPVAAVVRVLEYVAFIIGLMLVTRKLIEG